MITRILLTPEWLAVAAGDEDEPSADEAVGAGEAEPAADTEADAGTEPTVCPDWAIPVPQPTARQLTSPALISRASLRAR
jgi:hypothetical protein